MFAGRYVCNITAQGVTSASLPSASFQVVLAATPLALGSQIDFVGKGVATILLRSNTPAASLTGRFDSAKFIFAAATDVGADWNPLGAGDVTGSNRTSLISRNRANDVRIDTGTNSIVLRQASADWSLEAVTDFDSDGATDIVWKKTDGTLVLWLMNKSVINQLIVISNAGLAPADMQPIEP